MNNFKNNFIPIFIFISTINIFIAFFISISYIDSFFSAASAINDKSDLYKILPYVTYYKENYKTYLDMNPLKYLFILINTISILLILKTLITGKCSFKSFQNIGLGELIFNNSIIWVFFFIPFWLDFTILGIFISFVIYFSYLVFSSFLQIMSDKYAKSCQC